MKIDNEKIKIVGKGNLLLTEVNASMAGQYTCVVNNSAGDNVAETNLIVQRE